VACGQPRAVCEAGVPRRFGGIVCLREASSSSRRRRRRRTCCSRAPSSDWRRWTRRQSGRGDPWGAVALSLCTTVHPLCIRFILKITGALCFDAAMRPNPRRSSRSVPPEASTRTASGRRSWAPAAGKRKHDRPCELCSRVHYRCHCTVPTWPTMLVRPYARRLSAAWPGCTMAAGWRKRNPI
jgi:hypothetical protein